MKRIKKKYLLLLLILILNNCVDCGHEKVQVIHGLKNYQSIVGYVYNCGATTSEGISVTFVKPEMNLGNDKSDVFTATHSMKLFMEKVTEDTVKIIFCASEDDIIHQEKEMYGIHFIYENNCRYFNK